MDIMTTGKPSARPLRIREIAVACSIAALAAGAGLEADEHTGHDHTENAAGQHPEAAVPEHAEADEDSHAEDTGRAHAQAVQAGHDEHGDAEHGEEGLRLSDEQRKRFGIAIGVAGPGRLHHETRLPGVIVFNDDHVVHMAPRVSGMVRQVAASVGDTVEAGDVLAVIESRELADAKARYLAAAARAALADQNFAREKALREKEVSSEQDYLEAEQALAESRIEMRSAAQHLHAIGLDEATIAALDSEQDAAITRYGIVSPIAGVVTERHISIGENIEGNSDIFTVVDLSRVWVNLTVYSRDLDVVRKGRHVELRADHSGAQASGVISMVTPFLEESTRSATARVVLDNQDGRWTPGTFVTGHLTTSEEDAAVVVPRQAVQTIEDRDVIFVEHEGGFEIRPVTVGRADRASVEIVAGLEPGARYVAEGAFQLKATVITSALGSHAGHGH